MPIASTNSRLKRIGLKAAATVGAAAALAMSVGPALAETQVSPGTDGPPISFQAEAPPSPTDESPEKEFTDAAAVVNQYWTDHFTGYFGGSYTPPELLPGSSVGVPGIYDSDVEGVTCGQETIPPLNAIYCFPEDFLVADDNLLQLQHEIGDSFVWFVLAHEWGHAIQNRLQPQYVPQWKELQADCFAGAALAGAAADGTLQWENGDSQELFHALDLVADQTPWTTTSDHGDTSQRVEWFTHGVANGPLGCLPQQ
jgi:uncharacterized protein